MALEIGVDSFVSVADADTYWNNHSGGTNWGTANDTDKEKALREASQYIDKTYVWLGVHPGDVDQLLSWPRQDVEDKQGRLRDEDKVPQEIQDATSWLAEEALQEPLLPSKKRGGRINNVKAGPVQVQWDDYAPTNKSFPYVDLLVSDLVKVGKGQTQLLKG